MKLSPFFLIGFLLMNVSAFAELSVEDLGKIEGMFEKYDARMREFVGMKISEEMGKSEKRMREFVKAEIEESDRQMPEHVSHGNQGLSIRMDSLEKQQDRNFLLLLVLLAFIGVLVGLPQLRERRNASAQEKKIVAQQQQIDAQQRQIDAMQEELRILKQGQVPSA